MDNQRKNLLEALAKKGIAVAKLCVLDNNVKDRLEDIDNIYTEIIKFVDASDSKVSLILSTLFDIYFFLSLSLSLLFIDYFYSGGRWA